MVRYSKPWGSGNPPLWPKKRRVHAPYSPLPRPTLQHYTALRPALVTSVGDASPILIRSLSPPKRASSEMATNRATANSLIWRSPGPEGNPSTAVPSRGTEVSSSCGCDTFGPWIYVLRERCSLICTLAALVRSHGECCSTAVHHNTAASVRVHRTESRAGECTRMPLSLFLCSGAGLGCTPRVDSGLGTRVPACRLG